MHFNPTQRELRLKVVYYGPALSGKTTNLQALHALAPPEKVGQLTELESRDDRTLFFDLLPLFVRVGAGLKVKLTLLTVPGQLIHASTRRIMLRGADGVAFVADSRLRELKTNRVAFTGLIENLSRNGQRDDLPMVVQFNKRDLKEILGVRELARFGARRPNNPLYTSVAVNGDGVIETLRGLLSLIWDDLDAQHQLSETLKITRAEFLDGIFEGWQKPEVVYPQTP